MESEENNGSAIEEMGGDRVRVGREQKPEGEASRLHRAGIRTRPDYSGLAQTEI